MIYTASFFEEQHFGTDRLVSIAMEMPSWFESGFSGRTIVVNELLQPTWNMVDSYKSGIMTVPEYRRHYRRFLYTRIEGYLYELENGRSGAKRALKILELEDGDTLLCWERYGQFCHRIIVADLLTRNGVEVQRK